MRVDRPKSSKGCLYTFNRLHSHFDKFGPPNLVELTLRLSPRLKRPSTIVLQTNVQFNSNRHFLNGPSNLRTVHFNSFKSFGILDVHRCLILKPKRVIPVAHWSRLRYLKELQSNGLSVSSALVLDALVLVLVVHTLLLNTTLNGLLTLLIISKLITNKYLHFKSFASIQGYMLVTDVGDEMCWWQF